MGPVSHSHQIPSACIAVGAFTNSIVYPHFYSRFSLVLALDIYLKYDCLYFTALEQSS